MSPVARGVVAVPASGIGLTRVAGVTLLERAVRTLWYAGIREVLVVAPGGSLPKAVRGRIERLGVALALAAPGEGGRLARGTLPSGGGDLVVLDGGALVDARLPGLLAAAGGERVCLLPAGGGRGGASPPPVRLAGRELRFAGAARLSPARLGALDFAAADGLAAAAAAAVAGDARLALDLGGASDYRPDMRAHVPFLHLPVRGPEDAELGKRLLIEAAQKRVLDWPAWYIHRPLENAIVARICEWAVTPNQLTVLTNLAALAALVLLAAGRLGAGVAVALVVGVLDGLDGKQARVKLHFSPIGEWEHHLDKLYEFGWYVAIAWHLAGAGWSPGAWAALGVILAAAGLDLALTALFRARRGIQFDDSGSFARRLRVLAGRRNTYLWTFAPFALAGAAATGFTAVAAYAGLSLLVKGSGIVAGLLRPPATGEGP